MFGCQPLCRFMIKVNLVFTLLLTSAAGAFSQATYALRVDMGALMFGGNIVDVDPGPGWKGDNLNEQQNGLFLECINGISIKQKLNLGVGVGWLNFEGIQGYSLYGDFQYLPLRSKLTPLIGAKFGTTHIWNQYQDGQSTALVDFSAGISYKLNKKIGISLSSGVTFTQQALLLPLRLGLQIR